MVIIWMSASFNNYLIGYQLKYIQGNIYENTLAAQCSEIIAYVLSGTLLYWLDFKKVLVFAFIIGLSGELALIISQTENQLYLIIIIFAAKIGISSSFNTVFITNNKLFPVSIIATTYGICNTFCRTATIFTPYIAELKPESIS